MWFGFFRLGVAGTWECQVLLTVTVTESTAPVTGHKITLLEHTDFQYMLRGPCWGSGKVRPCQNRDITPNTSTQKWSSLRGIASNMFLRQKTAMWAMLRCPHFANISIQAVQTCSNVNSVMLNERAKREQLFVLYS